MSLTYKYPSHLLKKKWNQLPQAIAHFPLPKVFVIGGTGFSSIR
jgi:hypothetical protein